MKLTKDFSLVSETALIVDNLSEGFGDWYVIILPFGKDWQKLSR